MLAFVKHLRYLPRPPVIEKRRLRAEGFGKREGDAHGVQGRGIRTLIRRRRSFHLIGPVPREFAKGDALASLFSLERSPLRPLAAEYRGEVQ
jgi:hypothetical protein